RSCCAPSRSWLATSRRAAQRKWIQWSPFDTNEAAMFSIDKTVPVNANLKPGDPVLTRDHIWEGLLMKAYDAKPFVHLMTKCDVTREFENGIERDIVFRGMELTERLIFYPKTKVEFLRTKGIEMGTITNEIVEDSTGGLHLR